MVSIETSSVSAKAARVELPFQVDDSEPVARSLAAGGELALSDDGKPDPVKLSILMAAFNEELTILRVVRSILQARFPCEAELIIVDDGSTDATQELLKQIDDPRVIVHRHTENSGKGQCIMTALSLATGTHMVPFDADMEYAPEDLAAMLSPVIKGRADVVYGVRLFGCNTVYQSYRYAVGNKVMTHLANLLYNSALNDMHTCLKMVPLPLMRELNLTETGFGLDTQITARLLLAGVRPFEVPVSYYSRSHEQGKKINWRDAVRCLWILFRTRFAGKNRVRVKTDSRQHVLGSVEEHESGV
jgi:glycosyltransferase involved in cell wall biosynthesis